MITLGWLFVSGIAFILSSILVAKYAEKRGLEKERLIKVLLATGGVFTIAPGVVTVAMWISAIL